MERTVVVERTDSGGLEMERVGVRGGAILCVDGVTVVGRVGCVRSWGAVGVVRRVADGVVLCLTTDRLDVAGVVRFTRGVGVVTVRFTLGVGVVTVRLRVMERVGSVRGVGAVQVRVVEVVARGSLRTVGATGCLVCVGVLAMVVVGCEDVVDRSGVRS